jgi:hypothetical protein
MLNQMPYVVVGGGNSEGGHEEFEVEEFEVRAAKRSVEEFEVRAAKRSVAIAVGEVLIAEDVSFEMRKE